MFKYLVIAIVLIVAFVLVRRLLARRPIEPAGKQPPKVITIDGDAVEVEVDGQEMDIDAAVLDEIRKLNDSGQKIEAIKVLREATGLGLAEAKRIVESLDQIHPRKSS